MRRNSIIKPKPKHKYQYQYNNNSSITGACLSSAAAAVCVCSLALIVFLFHFSSIIVLYDMVNSAGLVSTVFSIHSIRFIHSLLNLYTMEFNCTLSVFVIY